MTPPTIQEFAGIFMLALVTAAFIAHPSGTHAAPAPIAISALTNTDAATIDGIETITLPSPHGAGRIKRQGGRGSVLH